MSASVNTGVTIGIVVGLFIMGFILVQNGSIDTSSLHNRLVLKTVKIDNLALHVRVAKTPAEHTASLNNIRAIPQNEGMLFVFDTDGRYGISTTNMLFPVDLLWLDSGGTILDAQTNVAPGLRDPVQTKVFARYVLMVNAGTMERDDIIVRSSVDMSAIR